MLRNIGIRSKILAVLALPVLVLVLAATVISAGAVTDARRASQVEALAGQADELTQLVRGLQAERALSVGFLAGDSSLRPALDQVRSQVSTGIEAVRGAVEDVNVELLDEAAADAVNASQAAHDQVAVLRNQVDGEALSPSLAASGYAKVIAADVELPTRLADAVEDRDLAAHLRAYSAVERLVELVITERDLLAPAVAAGELSPTLRDEIQALISQQEVVRKNAADQTKSLGVQLPVTGYMHQMARTRTIEDADGVIEGLTVEGLQDAIDQDIDSLTQAERRLAAAAAVRAGELTQEAATWAWQVVALTALSVVLPVLLALFIARRITGPLRRLTEAATEVRRELPTMVERMQTPGEGPGLSLPEIPVTSGDEIGRLAAAFNDVNGTTVQVAQEQAALRGSIAAMFVNVARRDQVLLSRQLAFIDQLERTEENPQTLENLFKLDHLATRMRRNAESLLVLAGIDTGRRLRRPMPLSDVVRTASSEIEHYERVDLVLQVDPPMVGHVALTTAHLLAELLENATHFSDPGTRVVVSTAFGPRGVVVTITDEGLGMSAEDIAEANTRIAEPPVAEVVGAQRLGFFVVGRLARRLDAAVTLTATPGRGTQVRIELPPVLFSPGTVVELPAEEPALAPEPVEPEAPVAEEAPVVEAATAVESPVAPEPQPESEPEVTDAGLPRRGGAVLPSRVTPPPGVDRPAAPPLQEASVSLPQRRRSEEAVVADAQSEPDVDTDLPAGLSDLQGEAPAPAPRSGLFSGFRARRSPAPASEPAQALVPVPSPVPVEELAPLEEPVVTEPVVAEPVVTEPVLAEPVVTEPVVTEPVVTEPVAEEELPAAQDGREAASELTALATAPVVVETAPAEIVAPVEEQPATPVTGAPALDILPSRSTLRKSGKARGGLFGRRKAQQTPVQPMTRREMRGIELEPGRADALPADFPVPSGPAGRTPVQPDAPAAPAAPAQEPGFVAAEPQPAPSSLFGTPVEPVVEPLVQPVPRPVEPAPPDYAATSGPVLPPPSLFGTGEPAAATPAAVEEPRVDRPSSDRPSVDQPGPVSTSGSHGVPAPAPTPAAEQEPVAAPSGFFGSPAPAGGALPARRPAAAVPAPTSAAPVTDPTPAPVPVAEGMADVLRQRSALASEALTELSRLSAYSPAAVETKAPATLSRRTPASTPAAQVAPTPPAAASRRGRNAADVRSMLSGFQAGVERGRTSPTAQNDSSPAQTGGHS